MNKKNQARLYLPVDEKTLMKVEMVASEKNISKTEVLSDIVQSLAQHHHNKNRLGRIIEERVSMAIEPFERNLTDVLIENTINQKVIMRVLYATLSNLGVKDAKETFKKAREMAINELLEEDLIGQEEQEEG